MEAFIPTSTFAGNTLQSTHSRSLHRTRPTRRIICAKRASRPPPSDATPKSSSSSSSSFAGMAAGPGAPTKKKGKSLSRKAAAADQPDAEDSDNAEDDADGRAGGDVGAGTGTGTGAGGDAVAEPRATGALGKKKPRPLPEIRKKTAADFIAEGVVDDGDDDFSAFAEEDIRFGIADVADPFTKQAAANEVERRQSEAEAQLAGVGKVVDVTGDGGVTKKLLSPGEGDVVYQGAEVTVEYTGKLGDGSTFDSSRKRTGGFSFTLGTGKVIKGWEAGVATMRRGEVAEFTIAPGYAYGRRGMPPVIPGNASLTFEIELQEFSGGKEEEVRKVADYNQTVARTPDEISREYDARLQTQKERRKKMTFLDRFYIISPFASQTGERPPWWVNPNITFVFILLFCGLGFYLVVFSGAIHIGYVDHPVDVNIFK